MLIIHKIRHSVPVYRGAATTLAKEIERIYKFSTNGQCKGHQPVPNRSGFLFEYRPVDIFDICRIHSNEFAFGELNRHIPSARWGIPKDDVSRMMASAYAAVQPKHCFSDFAETTLRTSPSAKRRNRLKHTSFLFGLLQRRPETSLFELRMRRYCGLFRPSDAFSPHLFSAEYTISPASAPSSKAPALGRVAALPQALFHWPGRPSVSQPCCDESHAGLVVPYVAHRPPRLETMCGQKPKHIRFGKGRETDLLAKLAIVRKIGCDETA